MPWPILPNRGPGSNRKLLINRARRGEPVPNHEIRKQYAWCWARWNEHLARWNQGVMERKLSGEAARDER